MHHLISSSYLLANLSPTLHTHFAILSQTTHCIVGNRYIKKKIQSKALNGAILCEDTKIKAIKAFAATYNDFIYLSIKKQNSFEQRTFANKIEHVIQLKTVDKEMTCSKKEQETENHLINILQQDCLDCVVCGGPLACLCNFNESFHRDNSLFI